MMMMMMMMMKMQKVELRPDHRNCKFDVFVDAARYCIQKSNLLAVLGAGGTHQEKESNWIDIP
jgi:hypothetical protein